MKRNPLMARKNVISDFEARAQWFREGDHGRRCQVCHRPYNRSGLWGLTVHHIIHGCGGRDDEPCNLLLVCHVCHGMIHDDQFRDSRTGELLPPITLGNVLWVKSHTGEWDEARLQELYFRALPAWEILPAYYMAERCRWSDGETRIFTPVLDRSKPQTDLTMLSYKER